MQTGMGGIVADNLPTFPSVTPRLPAHCRGERDLYKEEIYLSPPYPRNQIEHHLQWTAWWDTVQNILSATTQKCNLNQPIDLSDKLQEIQERENSVT